MHSVALADLLGSQELHRRPECIPGSRGQHHPTVAVAQRRGVVHRFTHVAPAAARKPDASAPWIVEEWRLFVASPAKNRTLPTGAAKTSRSPTPPGRVWEYPIRAYGSV